MSRTYHHGNHGERRIRVRGLRKEHPDLRRIARAIIEFSHMPTAADAKTANEGTRDTSSGHRCRKEHPKSNTNRGGAA